MKTLDPIERKKLWGQLDDAARKLGVPTLPRLHIGMLVEKDGIVLTNQREEGHSWTRNMWNAMFGASAHCAGSSATFGAGYMSSKSTYPEVLAETNKASALTYGDFAIPSASTGFCFSGTTNARGIVVGTGDAAFSANDYILSAIIGAGNGAGELAHNAMSAPSLDYTGTTWTATQTRIFNNNSGDTITVKEVGILTTGYLFSPYAVTLLLARDVLGSPVAVANGAQLTVTYEISMDFSSIDT